MKKLIITSILLALLATGTALMAQNNQSESLGLPGDNLNLYAVMKLFQESKTIEEFEKNLNDSNSNINNLDLNGDNQVDYIKVIDNVDGDVHNIVLEVAVSPKENQDVAVFTVQRFHNGQVQIQLTGDEQLYGKDYIIEPILDEANNGETPNPGYSGNTRTVNGQTVTNINTTPVQIADWPMVRFIFLPSYSVWHSPWYWGYYPSYWHTWRPYSWNYYYGYQYNWNHYYYGHYHQSTYHRYSGWNNFYYNGRRSYSPDIHHRIEMGYYKTTYSHPDQRKDGEATFAKAHPDQYRRSTVNSSTINTTTRRSTSTLTSTNHPSGNNTITTRRSTTPMTNKPVTNPSMEKSTITSRQSSNTVTKKSGVNPHSGQNAGTNHAHEQSKSTVATSSNHKSETKKKTETTARKDHKTKESENKESNHRNQ